MGSTIRSASLKIILVYYNTRSFRINNGLTFFELEEFLNQNLPKRQNIGNFRLKFCTKGPIVKIIWRWSFKIPNFFLHLLASKWLTLTMCNTFLNSNALDIWLGFYYNVYNNNHIILFLYHLQLRPCQKLLMKDYSNGSSQELTGRWIEQNDRAQVSLAF